jgi:DNA modification methylase
VIYHADCFDVLPTLVDGTIDNVCSDFPYGITHHSWDKVPPLDLTWKLLEAKSKDNANYVLFGAGGFTIDLINSKRDWFRYRLTWVKNNKTNWLNSGRMVHSNTEDVMIFGKPGHQRTAVFNVPEGYPHPCSALVFNHDRANNQQGSNFHNTQKPLHLMGYLLMLYTNPGDLILDPFSGGGSTLVAALKLGRRFIGVEKECSFYEVACRRLYEAYQQKCARRRTTMMTFPDHVANVDPSAPKLAAADELTLESAIPAE